MTSADEREWLEADGIGGFASGTASGVRTRRYHALLLTATSPPTGRLVLVNGYQAIITTPRGAYALSSQRYTPDVVHPDGAKHIVDFKVAPWPKWTYRLDDGTVVEHEIFVARNKAVTAVSWRLRQPADGVRLCVLPFLSGRDYHSLHHENPAFRFDANVSGHRVVWQPYGEVPAVVALTNGDYRHGPDWYRNFQYDAERERGLDFSEDLGVPGTFEWELGSEAVLLLAADGVGGAELSAEESAVACIEHLRSVEASNRSGRSQLDRSGDAYLVRRRAGRTIVAGYPWFTDWGRDTFIAMRGLCIATGRLDEAREILVEWAGAISEGMLPNRFPDAGESPEYNAVDASLWFVVASYELIKAAKTRGTPLDSTADRTLRGAVRTVIDGYSRGTRFGIHRDADGLLAAGEAGVQLTWMDAKVGDWVVTPRIGKPVEVQALWLNALRIDSELRGSNIAAFEDGSAAFAGRFWNESRGCLHDVVDVDHVAGRVDAAFRPNQILAIGGLPFSLLSGDRARAVVDRVEHELLTPLGLRSLATGEPGYVGGYEGGVRERDAGYHQGTVWPWLLGPFVEAWVRVRGSTVAAKCEARQRFFTPLLRHLDEAGLGHISEIADGDPPHKPRGCPFQAWSMGEALRLDALLATNA